MRTTIITLAALLLATTAAIAEPSLRIGSTVYPAFDTPIAGCRTDALTYRFLRIVKAKDNAAAEAIILQGDCEWIRPGTALTVEEKAFSDNVCVRPRAKVDCLWSNRGWLK
jgi:hypothetical protein